MHGAEERVETVIIGGGQAGLAAGYHLARRGRPFVILEGSERIGDAWRRRWSSLRLFSPARYDGLPGWRFPAPGWSFPTKDEMGDYLEAYAERFELPVHTGVRVDGLTRDGDRYLVAAGDRRFAADHVVVASGAHRIPRVPGFAPELDPGSFSCTRASTATRPSCGTARSWSSAPATRAPRSRSSWRARTRPGSRAGSCPRSPCATGA